MGQLDRIAILTSGGDAPGMNAAIRAVVRTASAYGITTYGIRRGFAGLVEGTIDILTDRDVAGILQHGGTMLSSARHPAFRDEAVRRAALEKLAAIGIDALIVIGGNGSQQGSLALTRMGFRVVGIASTIDNDLNGTETTIGVDTALNTATHYIDMLKDTATSHQRAFIVEVMGRDSGYLAMMTAIATGAEIAVVPEYAIEPETIAENVREAYARHKAHYIIVVAEGASLSAQQINEYLCRHPGAFEARLSILGHVQRGGSPTVADRVLASNLGSHAVHALIDGRDGVAMGWRLGAVVEIPLAEAVQSCVKVTPEMMTMAQILAR